MGRLAVLVVRGSVPCQVKWYRVIAKGYTHYLNSLTVIRIEYCSSKNACLHQLIAVDCRQGPLLSQRKWMAPADCNYWNFQRIADNQHVAIRNNLLHDSPAACNLWTASFADENFLWPMLKKFMIGQPIRLPHKRLTYLICQLECCSVVCFNRWNKLYSSLRWIEVNDFRSLDKSCVF